MAFQTSQLHLLFIAVISTKIKYQEEERYEPAVEVLPTPGAPCSSMINPFPVTESAPAVLY